MKKAVFFAAMAATSLAIACADPVEEARNVAESCGERPCPVGTSFYEKRTFSGGMDITGDVDVTTGAASGAYKRFGEGDCEYYCQVISDCPEGMFPVMTETCFTCGAILSDNTVDRGTCGL